MDNTSSLLQRIRSGSLEAFHQIFDRYYELLCNYAMLITQDKATAEEVADDVLFQLWKNHERLHIDNLEHYLLRATRNRSINELTVMRRRHEVNQSLMPDTYFKECEKLLTCDSTPRDDMVLQEYRRRLDKAIREMPPGMQQVFRLSREEDMSYNDIANKLGISVNTVKYQIKAALATLSKKDLRK